jgi:hypothetical protein
VPETRCCPGKDIFLDITPFNGRRLFFYFLSPNRGCAESIRKIGPQMKKIFRGAIKAAPCSETNRANRPYRQCRHAGGRGARQRAAHVERFVVRRGAGGTREKKEHSDGRPVRVGVQLAVGGAAGLLGVITLYYLLLAPRMRRLD